VEKITGLSILVVLFVPVYEVTDEAPLTFGAGHFRLQVCGYVAGDEASAHRVYGHLTSAYRCYGPGILGAPAAAPPSISSGVNPEKGQRRRLHVSTINQCMWYLQLAVHS
jgi:hypothetical protein